MNDFFTTIYSWFCDSSSNGAEDTMNVFKIMDAVWDDDTEILSSAFNSMGMTAAVISVIIAVAFYIWPINHPRFKAWWAWLIMLLTDAFINFGLSFAFLHHRISYINSKEPEALEILTIDDTLSVPLGQWFDLAFANFCVSIMFFIVASLIFNWFSTNCKFSPFRK